MVMPESRAKVLVIDDEEVIHASINRILSRLGYRVEGAMSAHDGLAMMEGGDFQAVITDLMMPEMNGLEMLEAMRERGIEIPTLMITGYPTIQTAVRALRLGAVDYIPKPFTRPELLGPLNRALRRAADQLPDLPCDQVPLEKLGPGQKFVLPKHSWAVYNQDGTMDVGVEDSFLANLPEICALECPLENDLVEQGYPGLKIRTEEEVHAVFMPLSGRVMAVNQAVLDRPAELDCRAWVLRILPGRLKEELGALRCL